MPRPPIDSVILALGMALERLEGASEDRPNSEDRWYLIEVDKKVIKIGRDLIEMDYQARKLAAQASDEREAMDLIEDALDRLADHKIDQRKHER